MQTFRIVFMYLFLCTARLITYNNGTVGIDAEKAYQQLISTKELKYDVYDYDDGVRSDSDIEFDLTVGPYATATVVIDAKGVKKRRSRDTIHFPFDHYSSLINAV